MFDYETLKIIWWLLIGVLLIGFAIMDGHDMGVGTLLPFVGRSDIERRVIINTIGPHWDGNQVWFITGGGALFAAWPSVYATAFSGFYWAMLAVLWALFLRPVGFDFRSKIDHPTWRKTWDYGLFIGGTVPPLIFGIAFGNLLQGVPFHFDHMMTSYYTGTFAELLNPFALLCGIVSSAMVTLHGSVYLAHRTEGQIQQRAKQAALIFGIILLAGFTLAGLWVTSGIFGYKIVSIGDINTALAPMAKTVNKEAGAWLINYGKMPLTILLPVSVYVFAISALVLLRFGHTLLAFSASALVCAGVILTVATAMFPFIMPSSTVPQASLTVWDSVSTRNTLTIMLWATLLLMPIIVIYTSWAYKVMAGKVTEAYVRENDHRLY